MKGRFKKSLLCMLTICFVVLGVTGAHGAGVKKRNVADLIFLSELILVGEIVKVSDGLDRNVPYTEVTMAASETLKGNLIGSYTFRQFGLLEPRDMGNGYTNLNVTPLGWPKFREGEKVMLFLYKPAAITGFRTTVGLLQGKFNVRNGQLSNVINNQGLFESISVDPESLTEEEQRLLQVKKGPVKLKTFTSFVRKAVKQGWFEQK